MIMSTRVARHAPTYTEGQAAEPRGASSCPRGASPDLVAHDDVVDLQDHPHRLRRHLEAAHGHQQRLHHLLLENVGDRPPADVDAGEGLARDVGGPQLRDDLDGLHPRVLRQGVRHELQRLGVVLDADGVDAPDLPGPLGELRRHLDLGRPPAWEERLRLYQTADDAERVVDRPLRLVEKELVGGADEHRDAPSQARGEPREADNAPHV
mmetsp:Transcript_82216/g.233072  ORF Transcript_82216/g.233072 Transcript_82216/m.233072 type:complete len:209 (-) Transcript_82216:1163-1789(-)